MTYQFGDRVVLRDRPGSVAVDLGEGRFGVLLDRQSDSERYEELHVFAGESELERYVTPVLERFEEEEVPPTFAEGVVAAAEYATAARPDLNKDVDSWGKDFTSWINQITSDGGSIGSGGFQVERRDEGDLVLYEITQHVVSLYSPSDEEPEGSAFIWTSVEDADGDV